jgi:oligopeptidase B
MLTIIHSLFAGAEDIKPPVAEIIPKLDIMQDEQRTDNYFWLRDKSNPKVIEYLEAENRYTEAVMKHTEPFQEQLYQELLGRIKETDLTVPEKLDDYFYYTRTETGKQYRIYCRKQGSLDAAEEILLDGNALAEGHDYGDWCLRS